MRDLTHDGVSTEEARKYLGRFGLSGDLALNPIRVLSGGQKSRLAFAELAWRSPHILLLDEPTRGIDIGAKQEIYGLMEDLAERGVAILFVSSEMEEILGMSDRTLVMHEGNISGELQRDDLSEEAVMQLATGNVAIGAET